eukprot:COSAG06_NODE_2414_length_6916_cov_66.899956_5_plen_71_part_00
MMQAYFYGFTLRNTSSLAALAVSYIKIKMQPHFVPVHGVGHSVSCHPGGRLHKCSRILYLGGHLTFWQNI